MAESFGTEHQKREAIDAGFSEQIVDGHGLLLHLLACPVISIPNKLLWAVWGIGDRKVSHKLSECCPVFLPEVHLHSILDAKV